MAFVRFPKSGWIVVNATKRGVPVVRYMGGASLLYSKAFYYNPTVRDGADTPNDTHNEDENSDARLRSVSP